MNKLNYFPQKLKIGNNIYFKYGLFDVTFPEGKKLERAMYKLNGQGKTLYLTEEKLLNGLNNKTIIQWQ